MSSMAFLDAFYAFLRSIPPTVHEGLQEVVDAVSPGRKRRRTFDQERDDTFSEQLACRRSELPLDAPFASERPTKRRRSSPLDIPPPLSTVHTERDLALPEHNPRRLSIDDRRRWSAADASQAPFLRSDTFAHLNSSAAHRTSLPHVISKPSNTEPTPSSQPWHPKPSHGSHRRSLSQRHERWGEEPSSRPQHMRSSFSPLNAVRTRLPPQSLHSSPTSYLMASDSTPWPSSSQTTAGLAELNASMFKYRTPMKRPSERAMARTPKSGAFTMGGGYVREKSLLDLVEEGQASSAYKRNLSQQRSRHRRLSLREGNTPSARKRRFGDSARKASLSRNAPTSSEYYGSSRPSAARPPLTPAFRSEMAVALPKRPVHSSEASDRDRARRIEQDAMRKEAVTLNARLAPIEQRAPVVVSSGNEAASKPQAMSYTSEEKRMTIEQRTGVSRDELCQTYPPELVELMEDNPKIADKILKKHGAKITWMVHAEVRRRERLPQIRMTEGELIKIRSTSTLYKSELDYRNTLAASERSAIQGVLQRIHQGREVFQEPPKNASHWDEVYWSDDDPSWDEDDDDVAIGERERRITVQDEASVYSPLTKSALKRLRREFCDVGNRHRELAVINGCIIQGEDLCRLQPNVWLNDEVVNAYMELLNKRCEARGQEKENETGKVNGISLTAKHLPNVKIMNSFFYAKLYQFNRTKGQSVYEYARVRRWTRKFDVFSYDMMLIPINQQNTHWTLGVVNFQEKTVWHLDSMGQKGSPSVLRNLMDWVRDEAKDKKKEFNPSEWKISCIPYKLPNQNNSDDCGVFLCKFADFLCQGLKFTFTYRQMNYFRSRIAHELLMDRAA